MSSGFIGEKELDERRQLRQKEWESVRRPDQPLAAPEPVYDPKSLFDKLKEQKQQKDSEYEEAHRFKNLVKKLDEEDIEFLDYVDETKIQKEREKYFEEKRELDEFKSRLQEEEIRIANENAIACSSVDAIKPKPARALSPAKKLLQQTEILKKGGTVVVARKRKLSESLAATTTTTTTKESPSQPEPQQLFLAGEARKCVAILPGIGNYDSSDSSSSEDESATIAALGWGLSGPTTAPSDACRSTFCNDQHDHASLANVLYRKLERTED